MELEVELDLRFVIAGFLDSSSLSDFKQFYVTEYTNNDENAHRYAVRGGNIERKKERERERQKETERERQREKGGER